MQRSLMERGHQHCVLVVSYLCKQQKWQMQLSDITVKAARLAALTLHAELFALKLLCRCAKGHSISVCMHDKILLDH